ncbi:MAG TPA: DNA/RNA non-specific endonuclease [Cyclobacteriaceae bacterium]|nr:DNA/RNA non-specific endonuclease [Cyclobacteriaceae bacterium]
MLRLNKVNCLPVFFIVLALFITGKASAQFNYLPAPQNDCELKTYLEFSLCYDETHEQARWVAYELTAEELALPMTRKDYFREDKSISTGSAVPSDYRNTGYDRGHLARAMYCKSSLDAYKESFLFSNISPQIPAFNRSGGNWFRLEELEVKLAETLGKIYAVSGPVFTENMGSIGANHVTVPGYFYKAILSPDFNYSIGFLLRHENTKADIWTYAISIDSLEAFTGLDFFPALDDAIEDVIEAQLDIRWWQSPELKASEEITSPTREYEKDNEQEENENLELSADNEIEPLYWIAALAFVLLVAVVMYKKM